AGRITRGTCFRLCTEQDYFRQCPAIGISAAISRSNLTNMVVQLMDCGVTNCLDFPYITLPNTDAVEDALLQLCELGITDADSGEMILQGFNHTCQFRDARLRVVAARGGHVSLCALLETGVGWVVIKQLNAIGLATFG